MRTIYFDMDGTFVNLYEVENWLEDIIAEDTTPYETAKPLFRMCDFARVLHKVQNNGYRIGIITWLAKNGTDEYNKAVRNAKIEWLKKHLPTVEFDEIHILKYGIRKDIFKNDDDILFDDEVNNRINWGNGAFDVDEIIKTIRGII